MKEEKDIDTIQLKVRKLRSELDLQLGLINKLINDFELVDYTKSERRSRGEEQLDFKKLKFKFKKYALDITDGNFRTKLGLNTAISKQIKDLVFKTFGSESYVLVVCVDDFESNTSKLIQQLYKLLKRQKLGKVKLGIINIKPDPLFEVKEAIPIAKDRVRINVNQVKQAVCLYEGADIAKQNVILLGTEFGLKNSLAALILESQPKSVLNLFVTCSGNPFWLESVD